jgi:hypothetical protein
LGAFAALKADGSITAWGSSGYGGSNLLIKPLEQVRIAQSMLKIRHLARQHEQKIYSLAS